MSRIPKINKPFIFNQFCHFYALYENQIDALASELNSTNILEQARSLFTSKSDYILHLRKYPFDIRRFFKCDSAPNGMVVGNQTTSTTGYEIMYSGSGDTDTGTRLLFTQFISRHFNNFADYEPYTKMTLHVPYIGFMNLPVNEILERQLEVYMSVSLYDGIATAWVISSLGTDRKLIMEQSAKIGVDIPFGKTNASDIARNNVVTITKGIAGAVSVAGGMASGQSIITAGGIGLLSSSAISLITGNTPTYSKGGSPNGYTNLLSPTSTFVVVTRPKLLIGASDIVQLEKYKHFHGIPLGESRLLSHLSGFTKVAHVNVENIKTATSDELDMIESQLKSGVLL